MKIEENKRTKMSVFSIRLKVQYYCVLYFCLFRHFVLLCFPFHYINSLLSLSNFGPKFCQGQIVVNSLI
jgi:hypothetical protein